jgi:Skp family chaperone for outer membrane proteins
LGESRRRRPSAELSRERLALVKEDPFQQGVPTVKALFATAALAALLSVGTALPARAQQGTTPNYAWAYANAQKYKIAVVDITYVFKEHGRFKQQIEAMQQRMQATEKQFAEQRNEIAKQEEQLRGYKPNSEEYKKLDAEIIQKKANFSIQADQAQKAFMEEEANLYYQTYQEVQSEIERFAKTYDIGLVLRFSGDEIDPALRRDIITGINRPVVFQNAIDITPFVLQMVNRSQSPPAAAQENSVSSKNTTIPPRRQ